MERSEAGQGVGHAHARVLRNQRAAYTLNITTLPGPAFSPPLSRSGFVYLGSESVDNKPALWIY